MRMQPCRAQQFLDYYSEVKMFLKAGVARTLTYQATLTHREHRPEKLPSEPNQSPLFSCYTTKNREQETHVLPLTSVDGCVRRTTYNPGIASICLRVNSGLPRRWGRTRVRPSSARRQNVADDSSRGRRDDKQQS